MDYFKYTITTNEPETGELLIAFLSDADFDTFEDTPEGFFAYLPAKADKTSAEAQLTALQEQFEFSWSSELIPGQNWNEIWESNFHPVVVGTFCGVRADFHAPNKDVEWDLLINPKMAFGTGHHETTWQCIAAMQNLPISGKTLLDYGCGTGILAILACKLGAKSVEAVDIESESYLNTVENSQANNVQCVIARQGTLDDVQGRDFDGILANINRHVILPSLPELSRMIKPGGWLLVSGILEQDDEIVTKTAQEAGFSKVKQTQRGNWLCIEYIKD